MTSKRCVALKVFERLKKMSAEKAGQQATDKSPGEQRLTKSLNGDLFADTKIIIAHSTRDRYIQYLVIADADALPSAENISRLVFAKKLLNL